MKRPTLLEGFTLALLTSLAVSILLTALAGIFADGSLFRLLISGCGLVYVVYLMARSPERVGRVVVIATWFGTTATAWCLSLPITLFALLHLGLVWLVRSLYYHSGLLGALMDLVLLALGVATAYWSFAHTGNAFLSVWCFLLLQALYVLIPPKPTPNRAFPQHPSMDAECFERAHRNAEAALRGIRSFL